MESKSNHNSFPKKTWECLIIRCLFLYLFQAVFFFQSRFDMCLYSVLSPDSIKKTSDFFCGSGRICAPSLFGLSNGPPSEPVNTQKKKPKEPHLTFSCGLARLATDLAPAPQYVQVMRLPSSILFFFFFSSIKTHSALATAAGEERRHGG